VHTKRRAFFFGGVLLGTICLASTGLLSCGKRIVSIDLSRMYPNLRADSRIDTAVIIAGAYPWSSGPTHYYYFKTPRGSIRLACQLDDFDSWIGPGKRWETGQTSQPIGDLGFFMNDGGSEGTMELGYRRYNLDVRLNNQPIRAYRDGRPIFESELDKKELEAAARVLDDAIRRGTPSVKTENVRVYQAVWAGLRILVFRVIYGVLDATRR
jgi:hypothetical protein